MEYDASDADFFVYAQRESDTLLSSVGHDIKIEVQDFSIDVDYENESVSARIDPDSLVPIDAIIWESRQETGELSDGDRHEISQRISEEVLDVEDYPDLEFESTDVETTDDGWHVRGQLDLHGESHEIDFDVVRDHGRASVEKTLDHTEWGVEPYSAMLGSLKVNPEIDVTLELPLPDDD